MNKRRSVVLDDKTIELLKKVSKKLTGEENISNGIRIIVRLFVRNGGFNDEDSEE